ncbi:ADP-ribosylglycohydrolase [Desulfonema ishimotonii]|uniref:ADP-ribosylglycohydrolase n=1 Tax=Desulfonema ishimotonii TaxID=45657 RepID=A0A401FW49_9BACT|nr:ADP-ribosylglycohydrolase family protein [Desulfonema ishimotonii]GBC61197.1 ADP-ribosylglycohydrolase [Desulfonema ishimotonii]
MRKRTLNHIRGCLAGGAVGDALGAPVEFMSLKEIRDQFGPDGISEYAPAYGRKGAITDDTQMTLFTAEGLILSRVRADKKISTSLVEFVYQAYLRWLSTQEQTEKDHMIQQYGVCTMVDGILITRPELFSIRAPGNSCLSALKSGHMGTVETPANSSKGCGGVMRIAPVGYFLPPDQVFDAACAIAAITHGHPTGYLTAGCLAQIISGVSHGATLPEAIRYAVQMLKTKSGHEETLAAIQAALRALKTAPVSPETVETLGAGWIAEEALAIGLYSALASGGDFGKGLRLAVNHSGDSDSTGAITGNLLGAVLGLEAIPEKYLTGLELLDTIEELAEDLFNRMADGGKQPGAEQ